MDEGPRLVELRPLEPSSVIPELWLPVFFAGHVFAGYWLVRGYLKTNPQHRLSSLLCCCCPPWRAKGDGLPQKDAAACGGGGGGAGSDGSESDDCFDECGSGAWASSADGSAAHSSANSGRRSHAEVDRVGLEWRALGCWYATPRGNKWVLRDVYGRAQPGEMQALLGPSGAGKSTLMDILAQRKSTGNLRGALLVDGRPVDATFIRRAAYVPQHDNFAPVMTALEVMQFYAGIILPRGWPASRRAARVKEVLSEMGLTHVAGTIVGGQVPGGKCHRGLSGGERKRLSIAAGIVAAPSVVFLDEPTTGLDSFAALTVMSYMRRMARDNGHIVIASIHQPRAAIWSLFDTVTLLSCGRLMYGGPTAGLVDWFGSIGFTYDANLHGVVSDWALDLVACGSHKPRKYYGSTITAEREVRSISAAFVARWAALRAAERGGGGSGLSSEDDGGGGGGAPPQGRGAAALAPSGSLASAQSAGALPRSHASGSWQQQHQQHEHGSPPPSPTRSAAARGPSARAAGALAPSAAEVRRAALLRPPGWLQQFYWTYQRELILITRNPAEVAGRTLTNTWVAATMGLLYYGIPNDSGSIKSKVNMLLNILAFFCLMPYVSMSLYTAGKQSYLADVSAKLYTPSSYYLAIVFATLPFQLVSSLSFTFIIYGMAGLRHSASSIWGNGILATLMSLIAVQVMHFCAVIAPTQDVAFMYSIAWTAVQLLFNNFFITFKEVTLAWLTNLKWLSAVYYAFEGMAIVEFAGARLPCVTGVDSEGYTFLRELLPNTKLLGVSAVKQALSKPGPDCVADAGAVLDYFSFSRGFTSTLLIMVGYWLICHVLTYLALLSVARKERR